MLFLSPIIKEALYFSAKSHEGQYRKGGKVPYIVHPVLVAGLVSEYSKDEEIISAALLHDVMEDCEVLEGELLEKFGSRITSLVKEVSFLEEKEGVWRERKQSYLDSIENVSGEAMIIIGCDKMMNMKSYFEALELDPAKVAALFSGTTEDYRWYYERVGFLLKKHLEIHPLTKDYHDLLVSLIKK